MFSPHTVSVYRPTYTPERAGNPLANLPETALKTLSGFMQPVSATETVTFLQQNMEVSHTFYTFTEPALKQDDVLKFKDRWFWVTGIRNACELDEAWMIDCKEWFGVGKV